MARSKNKRKQPPHSADVPSSKKTKTTTITPPPEQGSQEPKTIQSIGLTEEDLDLAIDTLTTLAENPSVIKSKACKDLRTAVYDFRQACTTGFNAALDTNLTARISGALADGGYTEARIMLAEMRIRGQRPKLGALCRWVRDLDVVSGLAEQLAGEERSTKEVELLIVLDAILRLTGPTDFTSEGQAVSGPIVPREAWDLRDGRKNRQVYDSVLDRSIFECLPAGHKSQFRIIETTPGIERRPANHHPAILRASRDDAIRLSPEFPKPSHHKHPIVPNLHLLKDVLSPGECEQIIATGESIGFTPDAPIRAEGEESSVLAHNFYWIVDNAFHDKLWGRVAEFLPESVGGKKARGLNRRFRVYRYVPGAEYRAHIDGAWPPSGIDPETDKYIYDCSPVGGKQSSLFTFLIYLSDDFDAGETTFFLPSAREGSMNAYPVKPIQGSIALFPHGETDGSLLHEGTGVRKDEKPTAKYVIRTDVLYDCDMKISTARDVDA
ncbi:prolyl 4-hydroxylase [Drepanopeziza brunnea f. sp. 'multigermtubi' MB_m1]|uniref:Prolyl 4-hydroxylase n=1 Tax=Marssonina brunnea f. sp. multigermtubi (strain MB_m1) TaxID=1072389 RepID=K1WBK8_MARBU|nr:prolyl 4-hydroxylase [Drepanopeziza brunnea f. sp. 'multigermtubi' MB_m1]EKD14700.1 prolyl 4-hydroxylase [Drepanopeziza brunnea f. sp. 'multigermtubi' MB_m1]